MEIRCYPRLSKEQEEDLPDDYVRPLIEGMYDVNDEHPDGVISIYVGYCDWEDEFDRCLKEFVLTVFHETMHILLPELQNCAPHAEKILAEILHNNDQLNASCGS